MKKMVGLMTGLVLLGNGVGLVSAQRATPTKRPVQQLREERQEARTAARCTMAEARIDARIAYFEATDTYHVGAYKTIAESLKTLADRLDTKGYNTTRVREVYKVLNDKMTQTHADYLTFIRLLQATKQYVCGDSQGKFKEAVEQARAQLKIVRSERVDIRTYYLTVVKPAVAELRKQKPTPTP